jgi:phosphopantetheinyl transferase (holo-ACP synthase)
MIGNDIIDLELAQLESNWQREGFLNKIVTSSEQKLIAKALDQETMFWYLWSLKEAAYKIYNRQTQNRAFMPLRLECYAVESKETVLHAKVSCEGRIYWTKTSIVNDCIDTVAVLNESDFDRIVTLGSHVVIEKKNGIPYYYENTVLQPLSKSHHGRFERIVTLLK